MQTTQPQASAYSRKDILRIAFPILVSILMEQLIGMTDTAFLGRVGEVELGASAIAGIYYIAIFMMGFGFSIGAQILIARRNGEGNYTGIGSIFYQGMYFLMFLAALMFVVTKAVSPLLLGSIISSPEINKAALSYIDWRIYGFFFSFAAAMFRAFFVGTTQTRTLTLNSIVMVCSNIVFNYILIFGKLGFPALGIAGAAIGSSLAEGVSVLFFIIYTVRKVDCRKYALDRFHRFSPGRLRHIFSISFWTMIQNFLSLGTWFTFFIFVEHLGERALAVTNIVRNLSSIPFMMVVAFASTCSSLTSNLIGAGKSAAVQTTIRQHIALAYMFTLPILLIYVLFPEEVSMIYTDIPDVIENTRLSVWVYCSSMLITVPAHIFFQSVSGTGNTRMAFIIETSALALYVAYCASVILGLKPDVSVCWTSEHVYALPMLVMCYCYMRSGRWTGKKI